MLEKNELAWKQYEAITKYIYETLGKASGVKIDGFGTTCKLTGKSGADYQIDVLTSHSDGIHSYRTAIECKYWNQKINRDIVIKVYGIVEDTRISKGIIVSRGGFTKDAIEYARHKNIGLVELRESDEKDQNGKPEQINIATLEINTAITIHRPEILNMIIDYIDGPPNDKEEINIYRDAIILPSGNVIPLTEYAKAFQEELRVQNRLFQSITKSYEINGGILINKATNTSTRINGVTFTGMFKKIDSNQNRTISIVDQVWLIMNAIFEDKIFKITESGLIVQDKK